MKVRSKGNLELASDAMDIIKELTIRANERDVFEEEIKRLHTIPGARGISKQREKDVEDHRAETKNIYGISKQNGKYHVEIHHISPETGRDTTRGGGDTDNFQDAVVRRDEVARDLYRERLIDFARYNKIVRDRGYNQSLITDF